MPQIRDGQGQPLGGRFIAGTNGKLTTGAVLRRTDEDEIELGTEGRTRTDTPLREPDFESGASTSFATPAITSRPADRVATPMSCEPFWLSRRLRF